MLRENFEHGQALKLVNLGKFSLISFLRQFCGSLWREIDKREFEGICTPFSVDLEIIGFIL